MLIRIVIMPIDDDIDALLDCRVHNGLGTTWRPKSQSKSTRLHSLSIKQHEKRSLCVLWNHPSLHFLRLFFWLHKVSAGLSEMAS